MENKYVCHSGGCPGSDIMWENECHKYGIETIAYSFPGHSQKGRNPKILTPEELNEGFKHVIIASRPIKRSTFYVAAYIKNLLSRNWFQVKNSAAVYAIGKFMDDKHKLVKGGTGWAVQMAIDSEKPVYFFDQPTNSWYKYDYVSSKCFEKIDNTPILTNDFAGIGTREIDENGKQAIIKILEWNIQYREKQDVHAV